MPRRKRKSPCKNCGIPTVAPLCSRACRQAWDAGAEARAAAGMTQFKRLRSCSVCDKKTTGRFCSQPCQRAYEMSGASRHIAQPQPEDPPPPALQFPDGTHPALRLLLSPADCWEIIRRYEKLATFAPTVSLPAG